MSGWGWVMICSMLLSVAAFLLLLLLSVGRWIPYFWLLWLRVREFEFKNFAFGAEE